MSASDAAVIDVESDIQKQAAAQLQFQDFSSNLNPQLDRNGKDPGDPNPPFSTFHDPGDDETEQSELLGETKETPSVLSFEYYQSFFNVDTEQVIRRIMWSMIPRPGISFLQYHIRPNPDLYGPFWICTTLIFTTAIMGNIANYLKVANQGEYIWRYDFHKVTLAATTVYSYAAIIPLLLWVFLWYRKSEAGYTFLEILCIYGYSLAVYIPISILWVIQLEWLQWIFMIIGATLSGTVLLMTLWPTVKDDQKQVATLVMVLVIAFHILLAVGFLLYFFHVPDVETKLPPKTAEIINTPQLESSNSLKLMDPLSVIMSTTATSSVGVNSTGM